MSDDYVDPWLYGDSNQSSEETVDPYGPNSGWGQDTLSAMGVPNDTNVFNTGSGINWKGVGDWAKNVFTGQGGIADYGMLLGGALGLYEAMNKDRSPKTWEGTITKKPLPEQTVTPAYWSAVQSRPYGSAAMGMNPFTFAPTAGGITAGGTPPTRPTVRPQTVRPQTAVAATASTGQRSPGQIQQGIDTAKNDPNLVSNLKKNMPLYEAATTKYTNPFLAERSNAVKSVLGVSPTGANYVNALGREDRLAEDAASLRAKHAAMLTYEDPQHVDMFMTELQRWRPVALADDVYNKRLTPDQALALENYDRLGGKGDLPEILQGVDLSGLSARKIGNLNSANDFVRKMLFQPEQQFKPRPNITGDDVRAWLAANPQATDAQIRAKMDEYQISPALMAKHTGLDPEDVLARYEQAQPPTKAAQGGIMGLARGGKAMPPRYLSGDTDGMADEIPSDIDGVQPAKLSHGEFVIPADVVSHLGNGNSDAGAKVLYKMMDRVRHARTGTKKQGKQINPEKFTPGGIAGYAGGGAVAFQTGGTTTTNQANPGGTLSGGLSPYIGDYVADYLGKGWTLSERPYQAYQGALTAGLSPLQQQAMQGISGLRTPTGIGQATQMASGITGQMAGMQYSPVGTSFTGQPNAGGPLVQPPPGYMPQDLPPGAGGAPLRFDQPARPFELPGETSSGGVMLHSREPGGQSTFATPGTAPQKGVGQQPYAQGQQSIAQQYMNPYLQSALDPTLRELTRQSDIARMSDAGRLAQAGAFGGSRQAIMESEGRRNLLGKQADVLSQGYASAFDKAMQQFNADQARKIQESQFGASYGLDALRGALGGAQTTGALGQQELEAQKGILGAQLGAGASQQAAEQASIDAQMKQFQESQLWPYKQLQFQQSLLQGLPVSTSTTSPNTSMFSDLVGGIGGLLGLYKNLQGLGK